jgi:hemerythrin
MVTKNSLNAVSSAEKSESSKNKAEQGQNVIKEMIHSMTEIETGNQSIVREITESNLRLNEVVGIIKEIVNKTQIIDNIVFQTKLLSFNASVEAARAGENGKGFAVVADEVGKLAQMSGAASKEISEMLNSSVKKVESIAQEMQGRVEVLIKTAQTTVSRGSHVAKECEQVLKEIVDGALQVFDIVHEISSASQEQSIGINEIAKAFQELDSSTQTNTLAAASTAASAKTINSQLNTLKIGNEHLRGIILGQQNARNVTRFIWNDRFALGVDEMDDEHKVLIEKINRLAEIFEKQGMTASALSSPFSDLAEYTKQHFSHEEAYMASIHYPGLSGHKVIHRKLLTGIDEFATQLQNDQLDGDNLIAFLNDWLIRHILGIDMKYAAFAKREVVNFDHAA